MKTYTKVEVAISSLTTAKKLYEAGDYIGSTILSGAGQQILRDICLNRGVEPTVETISKKSGHSARAIHDLLVEAYNQMKHADRDPNSLVEVSEAEPRSLMTVASTDLMKLKEIKSKEISDLVDFVKSIKSDDV